MLRLLLLYWVRLTGQLQTKRLCPDTFQAMVVSTAGPDPTKA